MKDGYQTRVGVREEEGVCMFFLCSTIDTLVHVLCPT